MSYPEARHIRAAGAATRHAIAAGVATILSCQQKTFYFFNAWEDVFV
jgi:hypothetical protein